MMKLTSLGAKEDEMQHENDAGYKHQGKIASPFIQKAQNLIRLW